MTATDTHEAIAARELEEFRSYFLYADIQLIREGRYVAAARQLQARGERRFWLSLVGCALLLLVPAMDLMQYADSSELSRLVQATWMTWIAVRVAMTGASVRARTRLLRHFIEALLADQAAALDGLMTMRRADAPRR
ncbi:MAG TPA: hypothetical protein VK824_08815 [Planctomycetota bacterium]|nr:hypothetical protein [Planctomycetota bacterium]